MDMDALEHPQGIEKHRMSIWPDQNRSTATSLAFELVEVDNGSAIWGSGFRGRWLEPILSTVLSPEFQMPRRPKPLHPQRHMIRTGLHLKPFQRTTTTHTFGGAKELGIVYINIIRGAKEPRNLQNHRGDNPCNS